MIYLAITFELKMILQNIGEEMLAKLCMLFLPQIFPIFEFSARFHQHCQAAVSNNGLKHLDEKGKTGKNKIRQTARVLCRKIDILLRLHQLLPDTMKFMIG